MAMDIGRQITYLKRMPVRGLPPKYHEVFGEATRAGNREFLVKRIACRIQSLAEEDLSERARRRAWNEACGVPEGLAYDMSGRSYWL